MRTALVLLSTALAVGATPSAAQEAATDTARVLPLEPLSVTILREAARGAPVPYAVSSADGEELRRGRTGAFLEEVLSGLPGVQVQNRFNFAVGESLAIRGFGLRAQFGVRGV
ncbi:MAG TPA: hypothetical protein VLL48_02080 [Longimicrobiales bacterium]|nr:hypothetical protein [Longimicrobiales bacterium]